MDEKQIHKQWVQWVRNKSHIRIKLAPSGQSESDHFLTTHAASEAALRRVLFVGLRMNKVTYKKANEFIQGHHITFGKKNGDGNFVAYFDEVFTKNWVALLSSIKDLDELWILWNDYAKPIRNHLGHGLRKYSDDWLDTALATDRLFLMRLDKAITLVIGGTPFAHLKHLSPRLPQGESSNLPEKILKVKARPPRPMITLTDAKARLDRL